VQIEVGYELNYELPQPTPMLLAVHIHHSRAADLVVPDHLVTSPSVPITGYHDLFGNWISRIVAPAGPLRLSGHAIVNPGLRTHDIIIRKHMAQARKRPIASNLVRHPR
jgi:hypothetical protein